MSQNGAICVDVYNFIHCSIRGTTEDSLQLAQSLLNLLLWLYDIVLKCVPRLNEDKQSTVSGLAEKACDIIYILISNKPSRALLHIAQLEEPGTSYFAH